MEYRILGPLEVLEDGRPLDLGRLKERVVLGLLLLHANEFVSRDRLIDELWGAAPPPTARKAVNVYVSKLRKTLSRDDHDPITTADGGYRLVVDLQSLDVERVRSLRARANQCVATGDAAAASKLLQEALMVWRGPTLAGLPLESVARAEVAQLDELRLMVLMDRIDCDLAQGRHEHVLGELQVLVREHPLRERFRSQQMLALYRADRQADALDAYAEARRTLVDDLGIDPSETLQRLHQAILRHDSSLTTPEGITAVNGLPTRRTAPPRRRFRLRRWQLVVAGLVILATVASAIAILSSSAAATPHPVPNSLVRLDPSTGKPTLVVPVGVEPGPIAITPSAIWTSNYGDNTVSRYDLRTHKVEPRAGFPAQPFDTVVDGDGNAWITGSYEDNAPKRNAFLTRLQAGTGGTSSGTLYPSHARTIDLPLPMAGYEALGGGFLWVIVGGHGPLPGDDRLVLVDLRTNHVASVQRLHHSTTSIAFGDGSAWIGTYKEGVATWLEAIRAGDSRVRRVRLTSGSSVKWGPTRIAVGDGGVWTVVGGELFDVDPQTLQVVHRLDLSAAQVGDVAVGVGAVWATGGIAGLGNSVTKIDAHTAHIIRTFPPLGTDTRVTCGIAATSDAVWVTLGNKHCDTIGQ